MNYREKLEYLEELVIAVMLENNLEFINPVTVTAIAERALGVRQTTAAKYAGSLVVWSTRLESGLDGIHLKS